MKRKCGRAIIIENEEVILMYRERLKDGKLLNYYAIPGGGLEPGETIEECTKREIKEEFNLDIEVKELLGTLEDDKNISYVYNTNIIGGNLKLGGEEKEISNPNNYYEIRKVPLSELDKINIYEENKSFIKKAMKEGKK